MIVGIIVYIYIYYISKAYYGGKKSYIYLTGTISGYPGYILYGKINNIENLLV